MEQKEDLRVQKTYDALIRAFEELLAEKAFEEMTVTELCARARTRTATFYSHFSDKYEFCAFVISRKRNQYTLQAEPAASLTPEEYFGALLRSGFDFVEKNEGMITSWSSNSMMSTIAHTTTKELNADIARHFRQFQEAGYQFPADPEIMTELFIGAMSQISRWWFENRDRVSKREIIQKVSDVLRCILQ